MNVFFPCDARGASSRYRISYNHGFRIMLVAGFLAICAGMAYANETDPSSPSSDLVVYAAGDIADCRRVPPEQSGAAETAALVEGELARNGQAIVLALGDSTYPNGHSSEFERCYQPTWGRFKDRTHPTPGNHEYRTHGAEGYFGYFGAAAGDRQKGYFRFEAGDWQIIALNSNLSGKAFSAQMDWLKSILAQNGTQCTLAYWHHPVFSSGSHGNEDIMLPAWRMLADARAELVLSAHDHHYERFAPMNAAGKRDDVQGTRQFIVGTGGARLTKFRLFKRHSEATDNTSLGVLKLVLRPGHYEWEFMPTKAGKLNDKETDRGSGSCR